MRSMFRLTAICALLAAISWTVARAQEPTPVPAAESASAPSDAGRLSGRVLFEGRVARSWMAPEVDWTPPETSLQTEPDSSAAPSPPAIQVTATGGVREVAVWLENDAARKEVRARELPPVEIDQKGSVFWPQMVVLTRGGTLKLKNSDGINHNVHLLSHRQEKNFLLKSLEEREVALQHSDAIRVTCDLHAWMRSSLVVVETPYYAVTDREGNFVIEGVPAGKYELKIAHHRFKGEPEALPVEIKAGEAAEVVVKAALGRWDY